MLFVVGVAVQVALLFVPAYRARVGGLFGFGGEERSLTNLDVIRLFFRAGQNGWGLLNVFVYSAYGALLVLAFTAPKRWVFLSGGALYAFVLVLNFFVGTSEGVEYYFVPRLLDYVSLALPLTGFFLRPPAHQSG